MRTRYTLLFAMFAVTLGIAGCSGSGAEGQPVPPPGMLQSLSRPTTPNTSLAGPAGFTPAPDILTPVYNVAPADLYAAISKIAVEMPRTFTLVKYDDHLEAAFVARSRVFNFPDIIEVKVAPQGTGSTLILYSASRYGSSDFGVNRKRVEQWLAALATALK